MMFAIKQDGSFVAHVYGDRIQVPQDDDGCYYIFRGSELVAGIGSRSIGVTVHGADGEILAYKPPVINMADFYPEPGSNSYSSVRESLLAGQSFGSISWNSGAATPAIELGDKQIEQQWIQGHKGEAEPR